MNTLPTGTYKDSPSASRKQDYAYRIAAAASALFLLLTWLTA